MLYILRLRLSTPSTKGESSVACMLRHVLHNKDLLAEEEAKIGQVEDLLWEEDHQDLLEEGEIPEDMEEGEILEEASS
jgi:hypothetical protein